MIISFLRMSLNLLSILVLVDILLGYVLNPFHPVRVSIDKVVEPFLAPFRRLIPPIYMIDFSPVLFILLLRVVDSILVEFY